LHLMITVSDNSAASMVGQWLGTPAINDWLDRHGLKRTRLLIPWPVSGTLDQDATRRSRLWEPVRKWGMGGTTPNEMGSPLETIAQGRAGPPAACARMLRILNHQYYDDRIASQIPPWVCVASKHGTQERSHSDVALVHSPSGDYVLSIYTKDAKDTRTSVD